MTTVDFVGATLSIIIFMLMAAAYFYAFRPKNKQKFKEMENLVNLDEQKETKDERREKPISR